MSIILRVRWLLSSYRYTVMWLLLWPWHAQGQARCLRRKLGSLMRWRCMYRLMPEILQALRLTRRLRGRW